MKKKILIGGIAVGVLLVLLFTTLGGNKVNGYSTLSNFNEKITIYKAGNCGCCSVYTNYFKDRGNSDIKVVNLEDLESLKQNYGVPTSMESCHTAVIGKYFVEGHVPLEAVEKLLKENPDIKGIAMPGMPSGSPGMPGTKNGDFIIYAVNYDGSYQEWLRL